MNNFRRRTGKKQRKVVSSYTNYPLRIEVTSVTVQDGGPYTFPVTNGSTISNFNVHVMLKAYIGTRTEYSDGSVEETETTQQFFGVILNQWKLRYSDFMDWRVQCVQRTLSIGSTSVNVMFTYADSSGNSGISYNPNSLGDSTYWYMGVCVTNSSSGEILRHPGSISDPDTITVTATTVQNGFSVKIQK